MWLFANSKDSKCKVQFALLNDANWQKVWVFLIDGSLVILIEKKGDQWSGKPEVTIFAEQDGSRSFLISFVHQMIRTLHTLCMEDSFH
jgi:hypothetical protein